MLAPCPTIGRCLPAAESVLCTWLETLAPAFDTEISLAYQGFPFGILNIGMNLQLAGSRSRDPFNPQDETKVTPD